MDCKLKSVWKITNEWYCFYLPKCQVKLSFINNTADKDGAAIYATDVERCTYTPSLNIATSTNSYTRSIFNLDNIFRFERNRVLGLNKAVHEVATAPSWFKVEPQVRKKQRLFITESQFTACGINFCSVG